MTEILPIADEAAAVNQRICILLTCFNRKEKTLACFAALQSNELPSNIEISAVVVDDGSTDGTAEALHTHFSWIRVERSENNLYWCRGMNLAFEIAKQSNPDFYLWLNDDTMLLPGALAQLLITQENLSRKSKTPVIIVGSTVDETTGALTYGGEVRVSPIRRTRFAKLQPADFPQRCNSMNGNIVLVPRNAAQIVGNLDPAFEHAMGDTDYALRANMLGIGVWTAPGIHGTCSGNPATGTYMDDSLPLRKRWKLMLDRKGLPWRSWLLLTRRHAGPAWPVFFVWPYFSLLTGRYR